MRRRRVIECNDTHDEQRFVWSSYERSEFERSLISGNEAEYLGIETSAAKVDHVQPASRSGRHTFRIQLRLNVRVVY